MIVADFGQSISVGESSINFEHTERNLRTVTVFGCSLEYHMVGAQRKNLHGCIFSDELRHTACAATHMMETFFAQERIVEIMKKWNCLFILVIVETSELQRI